jgi:putative glycosyltransferase (TIGR04372 family)
LNLASFEAQPAGAVSAEAGFPRPSSRRSSNIANFIDFFNIGGQMRIFTPLLHRTVGDFIEQAIYAATVKEQFDHASLDAYYVNDRPYKEPILEMLPQIDRIWGGMPIPLDWFDSAAHNEIPKFPAWEAASVDQSEIILPPMACKREYLPSFDRLAQFTLPEGWPVPDLANWHVVLHYREAGYEHRIDRPNRDIDPEQANAVIDHVVGLGGHVVRIGHKDMTRLPARKGYADWSAFSFQHQAGAVSGARLFIEMSPSGPAALCLGFNVPWLRCNSVEVNGPAQEQDMMLMQHVFMEGDEVPTSLLIDRGEFTERGITKAGMTFQKNTTDEIIRAIDAMLARERQPLQTPPPRNRIEMPPRIVRKHSIVRWGELREAA